MVEVLHFQGLVVMLVETDYELGGDTSSAAAKIQAIFDAEKAKGTGVTVLAPASMWAHLEVRGLILPDDIVETARVLYARLEELCAAHYRVVIVALSRAASLDAFRERLRREST
jgi:hypothetical protein